MKLAYKAVDKAGAEVVDAIEAATREEATEKLRQRGLFVTSFEETAVSTSARSTTRHHKNLASLAHWSRQLCVLVRSGTPLAHALEAIERQTTKGPWRDTLVDLRHAVEEGISLSEAMGRRPDQFDQVSRSLVAAGESSGQLGPMLDRLATLVRQQLKIRRTLTGAMVYPLLLMFVGVAVTLVMLLGVLPRFAELFESLNAPLPPTTSLLMTASELLRSYWWVVLLGLGVGAVGIKIAVSGRSGRRLVDSLVVRLPVLGRMVRSLCTARIARMLGVMLESKVPLLDALRLTCNSTGNSLYTELMNNAVESATRGEAISRVFSRSDLITPSVSEAIRHGEMNAQIGPILRDMAEFLDEENEVIIKTAMGILEPLILILLGLVVGFIALSLFIPLFDLTSMAGA